MTFKLEKFTPVSLTNVNNRPEKHGADTVPAIDLNVTYEASNIILDQIQPGLLDGFYKEAGEFDDKPQSELDGMPAISHKPLLRFKGLQPVKLDAKHAGYFMEIDYGAKNPLQLDTCDLSKFALEMKEGGTVSIKFQIQCNKGLDERILGKLALMAGTTIEIRLMPAKAIVEVPKEPALVLPGAETKDKPLTAEDVFVAGAAPGAPMVKVKPATKLQAVG